MRTALLLLLAVCLVSCDSTSRPRGGIDSPWTLRDDMMNLGMFLVDSETREFEGAALVQYPPCGECDSVRIPLKLKTLGARLNEWITLIYPATGDTVWQSFSSLNGSGAILIPESFDPPSEFTRLEEPLTLTAEVECLTCTLTAHAQAEFDTAWGAISNLDAVHAFGERPYRVGFHINDFSARDRASYPDKWVVFLYRGGIAE